jgi:hypothetical protein
MAWTSPRCIRSLFLESTLHLILKKKKKSTLHSLVLFRLVRSCSLMEFSAAAATYDFMVQILLLRPMPTSPQMLMKPSYDAQHSSAMIAL